MRLELADRPVGGIEVANEITRLFRAMQVDDPDMADNVVGSLAGILHRFSKSASVLDRKEIEGFLRQASFNAEQWDESLRDEMMREIRALRRQIARLQSQHNQVSPRLAEKVLRSRRVQQPIARRV